MNRPVLAAALAALLAAAGCASSPQDQELPVVDVWSTPAAGTVWTKDKVWRVRTTVILDAELTVEPGTVVKLDALASLVTSAGGRIVADGNPLEPIVFTSDRDDSVGGDTNGDGGATAPAPGDWQSVRITSDGSSFRSVTFRYAGGDYWGIALDVAGVSALTVDSCTFEDVSPSFADYGALTLYPAVSPAVASTVYLNFFDRVGIPVAIGLDFPLLPSNGYGANAREFVRVLGTATDAPVVLSETEVPYVLPQSVTLGATSGLTLADGVVVKLAPGSVLTLQSSDAPPVTFGAGSAITSLRDDALLGDTNGDGAATAPAAGDWQGVRWAAMGCWIQDARLRYASDHPGAWCP